MSSNTFTIARYFHAPPRGRATINHDHSNNNNNNKYQYSDDGDDLKVANVNYYHNYNDNYNDNNDNNDYNERSILDAPQYHYNNPVNILDDDEEEKSVINENNFNVNHHHSKTNHDSGIIVIPEAIESGIEVFVNPSSSSSFGLNMSIIVAFKRDDDGKIHCKCYYKNSHNAEMTPLSSSEILSVSWLRNGKSIQITRSETQASNDRYKPTANDWWNCNGKISVYIECKPSSSKSLISLTAIVPDEFNRPPANVIRIINDSLITNHHGNQTIKFDSSLGISTYPSRDPITIIFNLSTQEFSVLLQTNQTASGDGSELLLLQGGPMSLTNIVAKSAQDKRDYFSPLLFSIDTTDYITNNTQLRDAIVAVSHLPQ